MPDKELIRQHDADAKFVSVGLEYYLQEMARRDQDRATKVMVRCTVAITVMTAVITIGTLLLLRHP